MPFDENGNPVLADKLFPKELPKGADSATTEFFNYYVKCTHHPHAINSAMIWDTITFRFNKGSKKLKNLS